MLPVLQVDATGGGVVAILVTLAVTWLFYAVTLHLAATFYIGDVASQRAAAAAVVPTVVSLLLGQYAGSGPLVGISIVATLAGDLLAVSYVYRLTWRSALPLVALHLAFATVLGFALGNLLGVL